VKSVVSALIVSLAACCYAQAQSARFTVDELRRMIGNVATMIAAATPMESSAIHVDVVGHADAAWISAVLSSAMGAGDVAAEGSRRALALRCTPVDVSTRYEVHEHSDSVIRVVVVNMRAEVVDADGSTRGIPLTEQRTTANLSRSQAVALQSKQYGCTWAELPAPATSFWQDVLEPAVFVGAAVVTTLLFFTVRSQ
jgi:hypothetical protein